MVTCDLPLFKLPEIGSPPGLSDADPRLFDASTDRGRSIYLTSVQSRRQLSSAIVSPQNENVRFVQSRNVRFHGWPRPPWKRSESLFGDALCSRVGAAFYGSTAEGTQCPSPTRARTAPGRNLACARGPQSGSGPHRQLGRKSLG